MDICEKICTKCGEKKILDDFSIIRNGKRVAQCKSCDKEYRRLYYIKNRERLLPKNKQYRLNNKGEISIQKKEYAKKNKDKLVAYHNEWVKNNPDKIARHSKKHYDNNRDALLDACRKRYNKNIDKEHIRGKNYRTRNKDTIKKNRAIRARLRRRADVSFRLKHNVSKSIWYALSKLNSNKGHHSFLKYVPYTMAELKQHLELQFEYWMNWNNYGVYRFNMWDDNNVDTWTWQVDHIIPQANLLYTSMDDDNFKICWSLENLRPLSSKQNFLDGIHRVRHK